MALRNLFQTGTFQYQLPDITNAQDGDGVVYSAATGGLVFGSTDPQQNVVTVTQQFTAQMAGSASVSDPFTLVFKKDLQTDLVTVAFSPIITETQAGTNYTHPVPTMNTGEAGIFNWTLTPHGSIDSNYAQMIPTGAQVQFDGNTNLYNCLFDAWPATWNYTYMPMSAVFTIGHLGNITVQSKANAIQQNEFCCLTRPDALAGGSAILGQYLYTD